MKTRDIIAKVLDLVARGKIPDASVHRMLNGMVINRTHTYQDGMKKDLKTGMLISLSPDKIESLIWPVAKSDADIRG